MVELANIGDYPAINIRLHFGVLFWNPDQEKMAGPMGGSNQEVFVGDLGPDESERAAIPMKEISGWGGPPESVKVAILDIRYQREADGNRFREATYLLFHEDSLVTEQSQQASPEAKQALEAIRARYGLASIYRPYDHYRLFQPVPDDQEWPLMDTEGNRLHEWVFPQAAPSR